MIDFEKIWGAFFPSSKEPQYVGFEHKVTPGLLNVATFTSMMYQAASGPPWRMNKDVLIASKEAYKELRDFDSSLDLLSALNKAPPRYPTYRRWGGAVFSISPIVLQDLASIRGSTAVMLYVSSVVIFIERDFKERSWNNELKTNF